MKVGEVWRYVSKNYPAYYNELVVITGIGEKYEATEDWVNYEFLKDSCRGGKPRDIFVRIFKKDYNESR